MNQFSKMLLLSIFTGLSITACMDDEGDEKKADAEVTEASAATTASDVKTDASAEAAAATEKTTPAADNSAEASSTEAASPATESNESTTTTESNENTSTDVAASLSGAVTDAKIAQEIETAAPADGEKKAAGEEEPECD